MGKPEKSIEFWWLCGLLHGRRVTERSSIPEDQCVIRSLSEALRQSNVKNWMLQEHCQASAQSYRRKRGSVADEVVSISGTRRKQRGLSPVPLRRTYRTSTC